MNTKSKIKVWSIFVLSVTIISCDKQKKTEIESSTPVIEAHVSSTNKAKINTNEVCFVNNRFMGSKQIPVEVGEKIYYGCCQGCVDKLKKNLENVRFAADPLTKKQVDKALAFIVLKPNGNGEVLYFENEQSYAKYINP
jgi:hypothetical protein